MRSSHLAAIKPILAAGLFFYIPFAAAQGAQNCKQVNQSANSAFDFTQSLERWGSQASYNIDDAPHSVRSIKINTLPVFDESNPDENRWLYRWANDIHFTTHPQVISEQLLFTKDMPVDSHMLAESERILRNRQYVGDARIRILQDCDNAMDVEVVTREVWTLTPELKYKSTGGHASTGIGVKDSNFLGTGQYLALRYKNDQERSSYGVAFKNPNIKGSRIELNGEATKNSDGHNYYLQTGMPFYALDDKRSWNVSVESVSEILHQYAFGQQMSRLQHDKRSAEVLYGLSAGLNAGHSSRYSAGLHMDQHHYAPIAAGLPAPAGYRDSLDLYYPFVQYEFVEDNYAQAYNIGQIHRTEDLYTGLRFRNRVGYAADSDSSLILEGDYRDTLLYRPKLLLQSYADWDARFNRNNSRWEDTLLHLGLDYNRGQTARRTLYMGLAYTRALNLNNGRQLVLGGSNGLRGFDTHFLNGDASAQFTVEERLFTDYHLLNLARVGFAAFYDVGRVYGNPDLATQKVYQNVGLGLRLAPSKSDSGQIVHLDLAYPINSQMPGGRDLQFVAEVKKSF